MMCCGQMFVLKFSTALTVHKSSSALSMLGTAARGEQEQPQREKLLKHTPGKASCSLSLQCQLGTALPLPRLPSIPSPCASLTCCLPAPSEKHNQAFSPTVQLLALAHCLIGTKTDFLLPFPFSKINKLECFKSEAFIRPLVYHRSLVAAVLSSKSCVCDPPKRHLVLTAACRELEKPLHSLRFVQG